MSVTRRNYTPPTARIIHGSNDPPFAVTQRIDTFNSFPSRGTDTHHPAGRTPVMSVTVGVVNQFPVVFVYDF